MPGVTKHGPSDSPSDMMFDVRKYGKQLPGSFQGAVALSGFAEGVLQREGEVDPQASQRIAVRVNSAAVSFNHALACG